MRLSPSLFALLAVSLSAVAVAGCGATPPPAPEARATDESLIIAETLGSAAAEQELQRRLDALEARADFQGIGFPPGFAFGGKDTAIEAIRRLQDHANDTQFQKTPFDKAIDKLPFRKPPLHVRQWVMTDTRAPIDTRADRERFYRLTQAQQARLLIPAPEHTLYARVDAEQWYAMTEDARAEAVKTFYRDARKVFAHASIDDFVLIVTPLTETLEHLPALAVGQNGSATLTSLGRTRSTPAF